jgi:hypothetical protein
MVYHTINRMLMPLDLLHILMVIPLPRLLLITQVRCTDKGLLSMLDSLGASRYERHRHAINVGNANRNVTRIARVDTAVTKV